MSVSDTYLKARVERAITLQQQGSFVVDTRRELPLLAPTDLRYSRDYDEHGRFFDMENAWGKFASDSEQRSLLVLRKGQPPIEFIPQPQIALATATLHTGYVAIHNNGSSFELDLKTQEELSYSTLRVINQTLQTENIPVVVWQAEQSEREQPPVIRITNDSAMLYASSAIWSPDDQQLVAAQVVTTSHELLKAIKATLANNGNKNYLTVKAPDASAYLHGAKRGFVCVNSNLTPANAEGTVTVMVHPLSGDPQANTAEYCYIVVSPNEDTCQKFAERLDLAIPWPIQPEWAEYLLEAGQEVGLVQVLPGSGKDFAAGLRLIKNESKWQQVIASGLKSQKIYIS